jgi:hypothetical protein
MQAPVPVLSTVTYPPGATKTQARLVIDGVSGAIFLYANGGPLGALVLSIARSAGTDPYGNAYPQGFSAGAGSSFSGTDFNINSAGAFFYNGTPTANNLLLTITSAQVNDQFGNTALQGLTLYYKSGATFWAIQLNRNSILFSSASQQNTWVASANYGLNQSATNNFAVFPPSGASNAVLDGSGTLTLTNSAGVPTVFNGNANGNPSGISGGGLTGTMPLTQVDTGVVTVTQATLNPLSKAWPVPEDDANALTEYQLTVSGSGTTGTTQETLEFALVAFGVTLGTFTIGALQFPVSTNFNFTIICEIACISSTSARASMTGNVSVSGANLLTSSNTANATIPVGSFVGATAITSNVASTVELQAAWGSAAVGCTISSGKSKLVRSGA